MKGRSKRQHVLLAPPLSSARVVVVVHLPAAEVKREAARPSRLAPESVFSRLSQLKRLRPKCFDVDVGQTAAVPILVSLLDLQDPKSKANEREGRRTGSQLPAELEFIDQRTVVVAAQADLPTFTQPSSQPVRLLRASWRRNIAAKSAVTRGGA